LQSYFGRGFFFFIIIIIKKKRTAPSLQSCEQERSTEPGALEELLSSPFMTPAQGWPET